MDLEKNKEAINLFLEKELLISPDLKDKISDISSFNLSEIQDLFYLNEDLLNTIKKNSKLEANWQEFEKLKALSEKKGDQNYSKFLSFINDSVPPPPVKALDKSVKVITSFREGSSKKEMRDFALYFNARLEALRKILYARDELQSATSISRILAKKDRENVSLIGLVSNKETTKNENIMLTLEDSTGEIKVLINKNKPEIYDLAKDIVMDEAVGVSGVNGENIVFANNLILPDIPVSNELKKSPEDGYALFLSDVHVGSNNFLAEDFDRFLAWLNQKSGNDKQKEIASKVKYIFIIGDLVDGVGVYPGQEDDLNIKDMYDQYKACAELLKKVPPHINIIICPGNHDAVRGAEPQPPIYEYLCKDFYEMPNITLVSNPAMVNIHYSETFPGYNVLMYHGYSFDHYIADVDSIRNNGGYDRADLIMKFLLRRRHLAPTHTSTQYVPYSDEDPLVITVIPDFFVTGHIHKSSVSHYKNITLISGSCWQSKTAFQEKLGHNPEPSRVPIINLSTREVKVIKFGKQ